jgi:hypothetical protein
MTNMGYGQTMPKTNAIIKPRRPLTFSCRSISEAFKIISALNPRPKDRWAHILVEADGTITLTFRKL